MIIASYKYYVTVKLLHLGINIFLASTIVKRHNDLFRKNLGALSDEQVE